MKPCAIGVHVRDIRTGIAYRVTGTCDCVVQNYGAYVDALHLNADGVRESRFLDWAVLEPLNAEDGAGDG